MSTCTGLPSLKSAFTSVTFCKVILPNGIGLYAKMSHGLRCELVCDFYPCSAEGNSFTFWIALLSICFPGLLEEDVTVYTHANEQTLPKKGHLP